MSSGKDYVNSVSPKASYDPNDIRQASIVYQNQSHLAFEILKFNYEVNIRDECKGLDPKDVVELALKLTKIAINPLKHMEK